MTAATLETLLPNQAMPAPAAVAVLLPVLPLEVHQMSRANLGPPLLCLQRTTPLWCCCSSYASVRDAARWPPWTSLHRSTGASWLANLGREPATLELEPAGQVTFPHGATPAQKTTLSSVMHEPAAK
jgi:hypothetical protein